MLSRTRPLGRPLGAVRPTAPALRPATFRPQRSIVCAAAASGGADDPYLVLGVKPDADNNEINRAYNVLKSKHRGNTQELKKVEAAHSRLMLSALSRRMQGQGVDKDIKFADREPLFPWRPRRWDATPKIMMLFMAIQLALVAFAFQAPSMSKAIGCMLVGIAGNVMKQNAIFPPPQDPEMATEEEEGRAGKNFVRGALLGLLATFLGIAIMSVPEYALQVIGNKVPEGMVQPALIVSLKVAGAGLFNWVMTAFYY